MVVPSVVVTVPIELLLPVPCADRVARMAGPCCAGPLIWRLVPASALEEVLNGDRQLADAAAGGVEDGVGDGGGDADLADLADALDAEGVDDLVADLDELHLDVGRVGVD